MRDMVLGIMEFDERRRPQRTLSSPTPTAASARSSLNSSRNTNNNNNNKDDDVRNKLQPKVGDRRTMKEEGGGVRAWMSMLFTGNNSTSRLRRKRSLKRMKKRENSIKEEEQVFGVSEMENEDEDSYELELSERLNHERQVTGSRTVQPNQDGVKSPLVEQFINSHKLQWSSSSSSTCSSLSLGSLCDLSSASQSNQLQLNETAQELLLGKRRSPRPSRDDVEKERDDRLIGWRLLAARGNLNDISLLSESSDSELELLHCQGPAEADNCSDDTSCSSVELVWTRPRQNLPPPASTAATGQPSAATTKCAQQHQFSVFELAKPSRAKGKSFGQRRAKESRKSSEQNLDSQKWVANPLFSSSEELERQVRTEKEEEKKHQSCESLLGTKKVLGGETKEEEEDWLERDNRKRWSLRGKSPFSISRDNIYLNQLRNNLRSNVSSIRSQLSVRISDTGKRASVLADQLLASIKDTTKELVVGDRPDEAQNEGENSFAGTNSLQDAGGLHSSETGGSGGLHKTKMFSLIYQHQQQANGQPVITRQPRPAGALNHHLSPSFSPPVGPSDSQAPEISLPPSEETVEKINNNNNNEEQCDKEAHAKSLRRKHRLSATSNRLQRSRSNEDDDDDDETNEEDFFKAEYDKAKSTTSVGRRTRLRSLNYWRRFRLRYHSANGGQLSRSY